MALIQLTLPVILIVGFIVFKLDKRKKAALFKIPVWISSTVLSLFIGHMAPGVMGFYAAAFCDLLLYPSMLLIKKFFNKSQAKENREVRSIPLGLPQFAPAFG